MTRNKREGLIFIKNFCAPHFPLLNIIFTHYPNIFTHFPNF